MTLYETVFCRRSVRKYLPEPLGAETLDGILAYLAAIPQIPGQSASFRLIGPEEMGLSLAPHYIVASCTPDDSNYANAGFVLEQLDLYLQSIGLGSLWYGMKLPKVSQPGDCIVLAFGRTELPLRKPEDFSRLPVEKISGTDSPLTRAVRLAPSAVNSQPWYLDCTAGEVRIRYYGRGLMKARLEKKLNKIDVGIAARFAVLALTEEGKCLTDVLPEGTGRDFSLCLRYE